MNIFESVGDNDLSKERHFTLENGFRVTIKASDPYGFWSISFEKGKPPKDLSGQFTDYNRAKNALDHYLQHSKYFAKKVVQTADTQKEKDAQKRSNTD